MRPEFRILDNEIIEIIVNEAYEMLEEIGVFVENKNALRLFEEAGQRTDEKSQRVYLTRQLVEDSLRTAPNIIKLYDREGELAVHMRDEQVCYDPGSAALNILDPETNEIRSPTTKDYINYAKIMNHLHNIEVQSTAIICNDIPKTMSDRYRLFLSLLYCSKPIVTGTFEMESFDIMKNMLLAVRGSEEALRKKPLAIFDACPSPPLKWSNLTCQVVIDAAHSGIPSQLVSMPIAGANSPVTLSGTLVVHTAETLSGVVVSQLANPGAPVVYGGSPTIMDMRRGSTPMGAIETMMIDSCYAQIGKYFGLPTHAYMGLSDAKVLDMQAGLESGIGAIIAALSGINMISGIGMLNFESCFSIEKLIIDNDICGMAKRLVEGVIKREEPMALDIIKSYYKKQELLSHSTTLKWYSKEHYMPSSALDRTISSSGIRGKDMTAKNRAIKIRDELLAKANPKPIDKNMEKTLWHIMKKDAQDNHVKLPAHN